MTNDPFARLHPSIIFFYFVSVILFSMFFMHPIFQAIAFISSFTYSIMLKGKKGVTFNLLYLMPMLLVMAILNPAFNHQGVTILFYLKSGNPITLESILYGVAAAFMFITVILWFSCYNAVMTSDKFIYLFGKIIPKLSLVFSMTLRFVPMYTEQLKEIARAQEALGRGVAQGNVIQRAKNGMNILSMMTTWALENAVETADSMNSRGYGLPGRTSFSIFRFDQRDKLMLLALIGLDATIFIGAAMGENTIRFYPSITLADLTLFSLAIYLAYFIFCVIPILLHLQEAMKWKRIESSM
ncbi:cobalt transporter [Ammoniphilus oxalaticus]|uniref:Cobalt transporter n=1 Tax=Ammoniphilus oxalaticus TaxID=66863 RepID=A0A419SF40_9BACL|nr:energy-coupling factor transporter transmembrane component T [Ammoniphilus oxalaticus]RKD22084.1 cobalt transporter [Ammoniphilus oxalaticus]